MSKLKGLIFIFIALVGGCGGEVGIELCHSCLDCNCCFDFNCCIDLNDCFLNGKDAQNQDTQWDCIDTQNRNFSFAIFGDGTGFNSNIGKFTFQQTGPNSITFQSGSGSGEITDIEGSTQSGMLFFTQPSTSLGNFKASCTLTR